MKENIFMDEYYHNRTLHELLSKVQLHVLANGYAKIKKGWKVTASFPPYSRIYYILDGESTIKPSQGGEPITLSKGNCYLIPSEYAFDYVCDTYMEQMYFHIKLCSFDGIDLLKHCQKPLVLPIPPEKLSYYASLIYQSNTLVDSLYINRELYDMLYRFLTEYQISLAKIEYSVPVKNALKYIDSHLSIQLSISEIAANVFAAPSSLCRDFKRDTLMTIGQYMHKSIMARAEQMLLSGKYSVAEISETLGFCDQSYFTQRFKKTFGTTPTEYKHMTVI